MHGIRAQRSRQCRRVAAGASRCGYLEFFNVLTGPGLLEVVESLLPEHRERLFPPTEVLSMFLSQVTSADGSCAEVVNQAATQRLVSGLALCSTRTGAYCRGRARLPAQMVQTLARHAAQLLCGQALAGWLWQGRRIRLVDGTTLRMADTEANQAEFPQSRTQKPGLGDPHARLVGLVCLSTGAVLDVAMGACQGKSSGEMALLRLMLDRIKRGEMLLGDGYYATYFLLCELQARGIDGVFEQHGARQRATDFRRGKRLGARDHLIELVKPAIKPEWMDQTDYDRAPQTLMVRELRVKTKTLVSTLLDPKQASKADLGRLYRTRWHIELDLRNIKATLGMGTLRCKTPDMVRKEIWVYLLAYNLLRLLMAQAADQASCLPRELSFKHTLQIWVAWTASASTTPGPLPEALLLIIAQARVGHRPGRIEPRAIKRRPRYPFLSHPRQVARANIQQHTTTTA
jgi:hypothetical protein